MELLKTVIELFLHVDKHLGELIAHYGAWTYALLFLIIFCETGLVVTPFLPGDSLLFAAGALAGAGHFQVGALFGLLWVAAVLGDNVNYWIGRTIGPKVFSSETNRFLKREHLMHAQAFYEKHGGKALVFARFMPIVRTFAPFVAGIGQMHYPRFLAFSVGGGALWISLFVFAGYFFGGVPAVKHNFSLVIMAVIAISFLPPIVEAVRARRAPKPNLPAAAESVDEPA